MPTQPTGSRVHEDVVRSNSCSDRQNTQEANVPERSHRHSKAWEVQEARKHIPRKPATQSHMPSQAWEVQEGHSTSRYNSEIQQSDMGKQNADKRNCKTDFIPNTCTATETKHTERANDKKPSSRNTPRKRTTRNFPYVFRRATCSQ